MTSFAKVALIATLGLIVSGCGGIADEVVAGAGQNTPLAISVPAGPLNTTVGAGRSFSVTITDIDGIDGVNVTLDGVSIPVTVSGSTYSITAPATLALGDHALVITARGKAPDGTLEVPQSVSLNVVVLNKNTPATVGPVTGQTFYTVGAAQTLSTTVTDPDGISSVTATLDGVALTVSQNLSSYSVTLPASVAIGVHTLVFTAIGLNPDGTLETAQTVTQAITVYPVNTPLVIGSVSGPASYTVGTQQTYTALVVDPDTVASVTATLDGTAIAVVPTGGTAYSVTVSANTVVGNHVLVFTAVGRLPNGSLEPPHTVTQNFTVYPVNTLLALSAIVPGAPVRNALGINQTPYSVTVLDPDGILSVTATYTFPAPPGIAQTVTHAGSVYSILVNSVGCSAVIEFTATGLNPDGTPEAPQTQTYVDQSSC